MVDHFRFHSLRNGYIMYMQHALQNSMVEIICPCNLQTRFHILHSKVCYVRLLQVTACQCSSINVLLMQHVCVQCMLSGLNSIP